MKYAVLGGSFDPIHNGHLHIAKSALNAGYDCVILVPAFQSPFKAEIQKKNIDFRVDMVLAAIKGDRKITVDLCEIRRGGVSYTVDTIKDIENRYVPEGKLGLIIGDDLVSDFLKWKGADEIYKFTDVVVARRLNNQIQIPFPHKTIQNDILRISSAELRDLIKTGGDWSSLTPPSVQNIIIKYGLYSDGAANLQKQKAVEMLRYGKYGEGDNLDAEELARTMLDVKRFVHARTVALHCVALCRRYGLDENKGWLAGMCHDLCKQMPAEELMGLASLDDDPFSEMETQKPDMLHGRAAAALLQTVFKINSSDVIEAVRYHTTGKSGMGGLAKIVYLSDKIESGREDVDCNLRRIAFGPPPHPSLDELFAIVLKGTARWFIERGETLAKETAAMLNEKW
ncbi:MAG: nicotinate (nicotinamide) nucleotide adenylyltransferase [Spirochaetaceae bacterium]|jgi:nicotinate-nucleotide adenylyltransferase|nr:nicotinate (nicotinamide) nucleotide adenylyltransferase [Spirochaetaceae bacterium]